MNPKNKGLGRGLGAIFEIEGSALPEKTKRSAFEEIVGVEDQCVYTNEYESTGEVIGSVVAPGSKAAIEAFIRETLAQ